MLKERKEVQYIDEEEAVRAFLKFRSFSADKQAFAIAFMNGMEFQRSLNEVEKSVAKEGIAH